MTKIENLPDERWSSVIDFEEYYLISNKGRLRSVPRIYITGRGTPRSINDQIMLLWINKHGYNQVKLSKEGTSNQCLVHRLVATAFIPNPENKPQVNHINGIKTDNRVENLEWATSKENITHSIVNNLKRTKLGHKMAYKVQQPLRRKPVMQMDLLLNDIKAWESAVSASRELGLQFTHISGCCKGISKTHGGFKWRFI